MTRAPRFYRALLHCYPAAFRDEYGEEMILLFAEQLGKARHTGGRLEQVLLWVRATWDALTVAPKEHGHVILQDLRYTLRTMAAEPSFTAIAILSLALGIGANTAIFSVWDGLLRASLPEVRNPEQLVILSNPDTAGGWHGNSQGVRDWLTYAEFEELRDHASSFSGLMASQSFLDDWQVRFDGHEWEEAQGRMVSGGYFQVLGVSAALGRTFTAEADRVDSPDAVISYNYWQRRFGRSPDVLGKALTVGKAVLTIIGIAPRGFLGETVGQQPDLWIPLRMQPSVMPGEDALHDSPPDKTMWLHVMGRLKPGLTAARAEAEANAIFRTGLESFYGAVGSAQRRRELLDQRLKIQSGARGASETRSDFANSLTALMAAVGLLLLIACANLANLLLARGAARRTELALRISLGANRGRLIRQLVTESLALVALGGLGGLIAAYFLHGAFVRMIGQSDRNFRMNFAMDAPVLAFTVAAMALAVILFGLLPAWQVTGIDAATGLKQQNRNATGEVRRMRWGRFLVGLQMALSVPLLVGAGLLARTVYNLQHVQLGYPAARLLLVGTNARAAGYDSAHSEILFRRLLTEIQRIPGVKAASFSENGIFSGSSSSSSIEVEGYAPKENGHQGVARDMVGPGFFSTLGAPMMLGREIVESDSAAAPKVCVVNEAFAKQFFAGRNPISLHVTAMEVARRAAYQVVGVVRNARTQTLRQEVKPTFYLPVTQPLTGRMNKAVFVIRTATEGAPPLYTPVIAAVRRAFYNVDATLPIRSERSLEDRMAHLTAREHTTAQLAVVFGCIALTLAAVGLYGVLSFGIVRRTGEIAIRMALGARSGRVITMILAETVGLIAKGLLAGAGLAYMASRLIGSQLYGIASTDPLTLAVAIGILLLVMFSAVYLPARRASKLDPMTALRQE